MIKMAGKKKTKWTKNVKIFLIFVFTVVVSLAIFAGITVGIGELFYQANSETLHKDMQHYGWSNDSNGMLVDSSGEPMSTLLIDIYTLQGNHKGALIMFSGIGFVFALALFLNMFNF